MEKKPTPGQVAHFSINADDVSRARAFYESAFGWKFNAWGPPGFFMIDCSPDADTVAPLQASLQGRRELVPGVRMAGFECTIAVADIDGTIASILAAGGQIVMQKVTLPSIGQLIFFQDPEGNLAGAMQYDPQAE